MFTKYAKLRLEIVRWICQERVTWAADGHVIADLVKLDVRPPVEEEIIELLLCSRYGTSDDVPKLRDCDARLAEAYRLAV